MNQPDIGLYGLAVMGQNLALNIESKGFTVAVFNRTEQTTRQFIDAHAQNKNITAAFSVQEFIDALAPPRKVMLMVQAGPAIDKVLDQITPHLTKGDIIIDGGNSFYLDTIRRYRQMQNLGFLYLGTGVSGGEEGARIGPSLMPGGPPQAYAACEPIFTKISAHFDNQPCCTHIGPDGAGHFVKMVHNGIEYADMQLISEAYHLMKIALNLTPPQMSEIFTRWNRGDLNSYLIEITAGILAKIDPQTQKPLVDVILDQAEQKGTGVWTSQTTLNLGVPAPTITEAVFARFISAYKDQRVAAAQQLKGPPSTYAGDKTELIDAIHDALYAAKICAYAQGFALLAQASQEYIWNLKFGEIAMIWRGGCIIRAHFLNRIKDAYTQQPNLTNLLLNPYFKNIIQNAQTNWRQTVITAAQLGIPVPAFSSALNYFDSCRSARLPANLLQAQRDYFGAHTYQRTDQPGKFHTDWLNL